MVMKKAEILTLEALEMWLWRNMLNLQDTELGSATAGRRRKKSSS